MGINYCKRRFRNISETNYSVLSTYRWKITYVTFWGTLAMSHITKILLCFKKRPSPFTIRILIRPRYHNHCSNEDHKPDPESCWVPTHNFHSLQEEAQALSCVTWGVWQSCRHLDTFTDLDLFVPISRARLCLVQVLKWLIKGGLYHLKEDFSKWKCGLLQIGVSFPPKLSKIS